MHKSIAQIEIHQTPSGTNIHRAYIDGRKIGERKSQRSYPFALVVVDDLDALKRARDTAETPFGAGYYEERIATAKTEPFVWSWHQQLRSVPKDLRIKGIKIVGIAVTKEQ